jgi:hypothetical protein
MGRGLTTLFVLFASGLFLPLIRLAGRLLAFVVLLAVAHALLTATVQVIVHSPWYGWLLAALLGVAGFFLGVLLSGRRDPWR